MKKLVIVVLVVLAVWLGVNYLRTGTLSLFPVAASPAEQHLRDLEAEMRAIDDKIAAAGRAAGLTGMDTTGDVSALMAQKEALQKQIDAARREAGR